MQPLAIAVLSGLTPDGIETEFYDECVEDIPQEIETDLVAISAHTFSARRAYQLAQQFRKRGITVVLGGYHPSACPEEALMYADAVVQGPAEGVWGQLVQDAATGRLAKIYRQETPFPLSGIRYDRRLFQGKKYTNLVPIEFGRGCTCACEFCSVTTFSRGYLTRPIDEVLAELEQADNRRVLFVDDNLCSDRDRARQLFEALEGMRIQWGCQVRSDIATDTSLLALMARSGCRMVMIGFESLQHENLLQMKKGPYCRVDAYPAAIQKIRDHGMMIYGSFIFGYDGDTKEIFSKTVDFALEHHFALANFNTLNPMPGTRLYRRLLSEGRLLEGRWWLNEHYHYGEVMFIPRQLSPAELKYGCLKARQAFFRYSSIVKRLFDFSTNCSSVANASLFLAANLIARKECMRKMKRIV